MKEERTTPLRERMSELVRESWPFIVAMYVVLILCILFPALVTALPEALGYAPAAPEPAPR